MNIEEDLFCHDVIYIKKTTGVQNERYKANVVKNKATIFNQDINVDEGDRLIRILPNGKEENYTILDVSYHAGLPSILKGTPHDGLDAISPSYTLMLKKDTAITENPAATINQVFNFNAPIGNNAVSSQNINQNFSGNINLQSQIEELRENLKQATNLTEVERIASLSNVDKVEKELAKPTPDKHFISNLLEDLTSAVGSVTAIASSIDSIKSIIGL